MMEIQLYSWYHELIYSISQGGKATEKYKGCSQKHCWKFVKQHASIRNYVSKILHNSMKTKTEEAKQKELEPWALNKKMFTKQPPVKDRELY